MSTARRILAVICTSIILWLGILVGGILYAIFATPKTIPQHTDALWGAVYFETKPSANGFTMVAGLGQPLPAFALFCACLAACAVITVIARFIARK
ncbi:hypothetical protein KIH75_03080 [Bifidobacterium sp. 64T4]|uniref:hypothetical protein n=1 Tax=Bifidobacterium pongonis TaxID=2834432 RepID=UPI001C599124|nr:hypothetical protein [Bifidobacterium pongonis]MBW3094350.1 hypothetical protein [Bifidobacterium pongonis]